MDGLIEWYRDRYRRLPWRETKDPYKIWLSEVILQQTRVEQGLPYYKRFIETFPTVHILAKSSLDEVLRLWQGLGYYSRARNLLYAAQTVVKELNGVFPSDIQMLKKLPGVGDYTAAAIGSFAYNIPVAVVDGNVYRVLSRFFNVSTAIDTTKGKKYFKDLAQQCIDVKMPDLHNQAIMELGATICTKQTPQCCNCPLEAQCLALENNTISELPVKSRKVKIRDRFFVFLIIETDHNIVIQRREQKDIWMGLYQFPVIEFDSYPKDQELFICLSEITGITMNNISIIKRIKKPCHKLSHQNIYPLFIHIKYESMSLSENYLAIKKSDFKNYAFPRIITSYVEQREVL